MVDSGAGDQFAEERSLDASINSSSCRGEHEKGRTIGRRCYLPAAGG